ncbi:hypothetical protein GCM10027174_29600 [Salinifilum aidingensis]
MLNEPSERRGDDSPEHAATRAGAGAGDAGAGNEGVRAARARLRLHRERIRRRPALNVSYRFLVGVLGVAVLLCGFVLIPYPGPGWLIVFAGLGILATEFKAAHRVSAFAGRQYRRWVHWLGRQHAVVKCGVAAGTGVVVLATLWAVGAFQLVGAWFDLHWTWLASPLFGA